MDWNPLFVSRPKITKEKVVYKEKILHGKLSQIIFSAIAIHQGNMFYQIML